MMRKCILLACSIAFMLSFSYAQEQGDTTATDTSYWKFGGVFNVNYANTGFSDYWQNGGIRSTTIIGLLNVSTSYEKENISWDNTLDLAYGNSQIGEQPFLKADDRIDLNSKFGYILAQKLSLSSLFNFRTQFAPGFVFPDKDFENGRLISRAFSPAFFNWGLGLDYKPNKDFSLYFAPVNGKLTIVGVDSLRTRYMPEEFADQPTRLELGTFLKMQYRTKIVENVKLQTKVDLFMNYLKNFGNIDVNWENLINMQVNKYLVVTFFTHIIYDDDIKFDIENDAGEVIGKGPRTQFKRTFGVGFTYTFGDK